MGDEINDMLAKGPLSTEEANKTIVVPEKISETIAKETFDPKAFSDVKEEILSDNEKKAIDNSKTSLAQEEEERLKAEAALDKIETEKPEEKEKKEPDVKEEKVEEIEDELVPITSKRLFEGVEEAPVKEDSPLFNEAEQIVLKQMSNSGRELLTSERKKVRELVRENETVKKQLTETNSASKPPLNWYENEKAYILDPVYEQAVQTVSQLDVVINHYTKQLQKVRSGEKQFDNLTVQNGQYVSVPTQASEMTEYEINNAIQHLITKKSHTETQASQIKESFKSRVSEAKQIIAQIEDHYFPQYKDPKVFEENKYIKSMSSKLKQDGLGNDLLFGMFSKAYGYIAEQDRKIRELNSKLKKQSITEDITKSSGPPSRQIKSSESKGTITDPFKMEFDPNAFEALKK